MLRVASVAGVLMTACLFGGASSLAEPVPVVAPAQDVAHVENASVPGACWASDDEDGDDTTDAFHAIVTRAILQCGDELSLSETQTRSLEQVADDFVRETVGRHARLTMLQLELTTVLRPDPADPARPADIEAAERTIRDIARVRVEQDVALLRAIETVKAVLTPGQRRTLAALLITPPAPTL